MPIERTTSIKVVIILARLCAAATAHNVPSQLPEPLSTPEAWNVLEGSAANIDQLLDAGLLRDVTFQIANSDLSLRYLSAHSDHQTTQQLAADLLTDGSELIASIRDPKMPIETIKSQWKEYRKSLAKLEDSYTPELIHEAVFICPMHPLDRHLKADEKCSVCGMGLIRRHLPASSVYEKPGQPTMKLSVLCSPLVVGQPAVVKLHLARKSDGSPVLVGDLLEMHTKKIHLLINDHSLSDYHHEHPLPTDVPGEYQFGFTPMKPGPYRVWADVVPAASSVQEYVVADLPADTHPDALSGV